jgi:hypothetical protein
MPRPWPLIVVLLAIACENSPGVVLPPTTAPATNPPPAARTFTFSGTVFETLADGSRSPVSGAGIIRDLTEPSGFQTGDSGWRTDAEGRYRIENLKADSRVAVAVFTGPWYQRCGATATMTAAVNMDIEVTRSPGAPTSMRESPLLSGVVTRVGVDSQRRPWTSREVHYMASCRGLVLARTYTDANGRYELCRLPVGPGCLTVNVSEVEWETVAQQTSVVISGDTVLDIDVKP